MNAAAVIAVAAGGAAGSVARYLSMVAVAALAGTGFPYGTLFVNVAGSLAMGILAGLGALVWQPSPEVKLFLTVGAMGGFTTFSTFSLDVAVLVERQDWAVAALYMGLSVALSVGALFAGLAMVRAVAG